MNWTSAGAFFDDPTFDFEARLALGATSQGIGDAGLVVATLSRITDRDPAAGTTPGSPPRPPWSPGLPGTPGTCGGRC